MTDKTSTATHAVNTAPISADLRGIEGLSEQDAGLLEQAASMLKGLHNDERNRGNSSAAEGASCSADAVRRLAVQLLRAAPASPAEQVMPTLWVVLKDGVILATHDAPGHLHGVHAIPYRPAQTAEASPAQRDVPDWLPFSRRRQIAERHGLTVTAGFNALVRDVIQTYLAMHGPLHALQDSPAAAWMTPEGDRVVTEATMAGARKDGGAMLSSMRPYSVALVRAGAAPTLEAPVATPSSHWHATGDADPHAGHYDRERAQLAMGNLTDDELANGAFMNYDRPLDLQGIIAGTAHSPIGWMTAVKDRIRWLSRSLEKALVADAAADWAAQEAEAQGLILTTALQGHAAPVDDLAQLVKQLVQALRKAAPSHALPAKALDYLGRQGLLGSPLRAAPDTPSTHAGLLAAAAHIQAKASAYAEECGSYDPDTGAFEMRDAVQDHYNTLDELAEEIRLMADQAAPAQTQAPFQKRVQPWLLECFGAGIACDRDERNHRFLEESLELVQSRGCTASEAHQLVDYVFSRPIGEPTQEVGGVMVTLAALCYANGLDMHAAGEKELERISVPVMMAKIKAKQAAKPKHSPLPAAPIQTQENARDAAQAIDAAAKAIAKGMDYPWEHMTKEGHANMHEVAATALAAARAAQGDRDASN